MRSLAAKLSQRLATAILDDSALLLKNQFPLGYQQPVSLRAFNPAILSGWTSTRHFSDISKTQPSTTLDTTTISPPTTQFEKHVLYRGRGIQLFRILVRFKIFQLTGVAALIVPLTTFLSTGEVSSLQTVIATSLVIGSGAASTTLWYYSRRYVGELALLVPKPAPTPPLPPATTTSSSSKEFPSQSSSNIPDVSKALIEPKVRFSVLDFWGNRENVDVALREVVPPLGELPPAAAALVASEPFLPISVSGDRQYIVSLRFGIIMDKERLKALLEGKLNKQ